MWPSHSACCAGPHVLATLTSTRRLDPRRHLAEERDGYLGSADIVRPVDDLAVMM